jgi:hypothetical protein
VLDLWSPTTGFAGAEERDRRCAKAGLHVPPLLHHGIVADTAHLADLVSKSQCRSGPAEGLVLRDAVDLPKPPLAKWLAPSFRRKSNEELRKAGNNRLRKG